MKSILQLDHGLILEIKKKENINDRSYLTLIKNIFDFCDIKYINKQTSFMENGKVRYVMKYTLL